MTRVSGVDKGQRRLNGIQTSGREFRDLSEPVYEMAASINVEVPMRDGTTLLADIYRPEGVGAAPALVSFSPYPRQIQNTRAPLGFVEAGSSDFFVPRGYVHVIVNARGTGGSGGTWSLLDSTERNDLHDTIEWVAAQRWCAGAVGMLGISYFAMAQLAAAVTAPPALKAVFPFGTNESVFDVVWHNGLLSESFIGPWIAAVGGLGSKDDAFWRGRALRILTGILSAAPVHRRLAHLNGEAMASALKSVMRARHPQEPFGRLWRQATIEHPVHDDFWADRDVTKALAQVRIPVYLGCDWDNSIMHLPGTFSTWEALRHNPNVRMTLLPPGGLNWPWESMHIEALAWYDHWLKGRDTGIMDGPPIRYHLPGADDWRTAAEWPPAESAIVDYALRADGVLAREEGEPGTRAYLFQPPYVESLPNANPPDLPDRLIWETEPFSAALEFAGHLELALDATITTSDTAWITVLYDVAQDGTGTPITGGWLRAALREIDESSSTPGHPVLPRTTPTLVHAGEPTTYRIPLVANARRLRVGHRLRLVLTSSDRIDDAPTILGFRHGQFGAASVNTVGSSSRLRLPVLGEGDGTRP
ncbi:CocE/NonD family hydrolase [Gordonia jinghuaiqii]|uniref:CocE/NonD family hydrolase n=1 Tax=Gordonia jinghuaiqii TaxID=2758710 RepID=UPI002948B740|nr:CocE/NonD family hydrolase [Gordonia jinghuaiqii]